MRLIEFPDHRVYLSLSVIRILVDFSSRGELEAEAGGILLGQVNETNREVLVCRASVPSHSDSSLRTAFVRASSSAQLIIDYEFHNSAGRNTYLGEWHTHPTSKAAPSARDVAMIEEQFRINSVPAGILLMLIATRQETYAGLYNGNILIPRVIGGSLNASIFDGL